MPGKSANPFGYNAKVGKYYNLNTGRFVSFADVRKGLERAASGASKRIDTATRALSNGEMTLKEWRAAMRQEIKTLHTMSAAAGRGGWAQMDKSQWGKVGNEVGYQYKRLESFAKDIASGTYGNPPDGRLLARAQLYGKAGRGTFEAALKSKAAALGYDQERNILGVADHCEGCLGESARGWVDIGELIPVGERDCITNCHCRIEYRIAGARGRAGKRGRATILDAGLYGA